MSKIFLVFKNVSWVVKKIGYKSLLMGSLNGNTSLFNFDFGDSNSLISSIPSFKSWLTSLSYSLNGSIAFST